MTASRVLNEGGEVQDNSPSSTVEDEQDSEPRVWPRDSTEVHDLGTDLSPRKEVIRALG